jgi:predicted nucleotidyltransferase
MAEKKTVKKTKVTTKKPTVTKKVTKKATDKKAKTKSKKNNEESFGDGGIVIVEDNLVIDQEKINEERRAYLEEAKSQESSD